MHTIKGGTKFWAVVLAVLALTVVALVGRFTGELGLSISGIVCTFIGGNAVITRAAIQAKAPES